MTSRDARFTAESVPVPDYAAVQGLHRSDPRAPGIRRLRAADFVRYVGSDGAEITDAPTLARIRALAIPPAWRDVWIEPDPLGHIQATGVDSRGRTQYRYHQLWREQRDAQKFDHMLRFAGALPLLREATLADLRHQELDRGRVVASAVRLIDLGLFRIGGERYAELDHHYGVATLEKRHVSVGPDSVTFDYIAKEGKRRTITVTDPALLATIGALAGLDSSVDALFCWQDGGIWHPMHSHDIGAYIGGNAGGHYTAKEFRTWNATVLMALLLASEGSPTSARAATTTVRAAIGEVAAWLGDTPAVARASYIDPRIISRYLAAGELAGVPAGPASLPAGAQAEQAVAALLRGKAHAD
ncbi:MAG TPA: DNA topoisomerase IB [Streptosporangiaceae bacterium]|nr:DNA topoisomerase IB [Streptosporangiaceae bacterium]